MDLVHRYLKKNSDQDEENTTSTWPVGLLQEKFSIYSKFSKNTKKTISAFTIPLFKMAITSKLLMIELLFLSF